MRRAERDATLVPPRRDRLIVLCHKLLESRSESSAVSPRLCGKELLPQSTLRRAENAKITIWSRLRAALCSASLFFGATLWLNAVNGANAVPAATPDATKKQDKDAIARGAFAEAAKVLLHPRCMNCHPAQKAPLQFDDRLPHTQRVQRGPDGKGVHGMRCDACHQLTNQPGVHMPPGAPNWHLPPPQMPMVFEHKTPGQLCRQLKDPKQNGGKTLEQIFRHISADPLVLWSWSPGEGRSIPPLSHAEFVSQMEAWIKHGAACPK